MTKTFAKGIFYFVATVLIMWTGYLTYSFVSSVLPNAHFIIPMFSLVVFDLGMIAWLKVFLDQAEGSNQRAVAIGLTVFDFLGVGLMVLAEVFLGGQTLAVAPDNLGEYAVWGIAIWTVVNVGGVIAFHAFDPEARRKMAIRSEMDAVMESAYKQLKTKRQENSAALAHTISEGMMKQVSHDLLTDRDSDGIPDVMQPGERTTALPDRKDYHVTSLLTDGDVGRFNFSTLGEAQTHARKLLNSPHCQHVLIRYNDQLVEQLTGRGFEPLAPAPSGQPIRANNAPRQRNGVPDLEDTITVAPPQRQRVASDSPNADRPVLSRAEQNQQSDPVALMVEMLGEETTKRVLDQILPK